jgi:hypothetical protein
MVIKDQPSKLRRTVKRKAGARLNQHEITRHAVSIVALLVNDRCLAGSDAKEVLAKALALLREE